MASGFDIHDAARRGNIATITMYIRAGGDLYAQDREGNPPLHVASRHGREASVAAFLGAGVDPAALNSEGRTPLFYAQGNGHEGCAALLRGESPPTPRSSSPREQQQQQQKGGDGGDWDREREQRKKKKKKDKDKDKDKDTGGKSSTGDKKNSSFFGGEDSVAAAAPSSMLPPPPPPTASSTAVQQAAENPPLVATLPKPQQESGGGHDWHLCHDEHGNAYYYSETTGESVWAEVREDGTGASNAAQEESPLPNPSTATKQHHNQHQPPEGWSFHHDPDTGHGYYLHEVSATSVWAGIDGSFPGLEDDQASGGVRGTGFDSVDDVDGVSDACTDWDAGILVAAAGQRPAPTAPPPFSSTLELAELNAAEQGADERTCEGDEVDNSMLLCTQGVMSTNDFFAAQQLEIYPSCSGGSPMASAPPAAESGGRRSSCSPLPATGAGDDNKMWPRSPAGSVAAAEDSLESVPGNTKWSADRGRGTNLQEERKYDGTRSFRGGNQPQSPVHPAVPSSSETETPPTVQDGEEPGVEARPLTGGPPPAAVRVGVWDTATVTSNSSSTPVSSSLSNHFNINLSGNGDSEALSSGDPATPSKYESLLESPGAVASAIGGGSGYPASTSLYPKLVDRNGFAGDLPDGGGGDGNGLQEDGKGGRTGKMDAPPSGTPRTDTLDGSLADAAERSLSVKDNGLHRMGGAGGGT